MSCSKGCSKLILSISCVLTMLVGIALTTIGVYTFIKINDYVGTLDRTMLGTSGAILAVGLFLLIAGLVGCVGGCGEKHGALTAFIIMMCILFVMEVGVAIAAFVYKGKVIDFLRGPLHSTFEKYDSDPAITKIFDSWQSELKCCGVNGPIDYKTNATSSGVPDSCYPGGKQSSGVVAYTTGCLDKLTSMMMKYVQYVGIAGIVIGLWEIFVIIAAIVIKRGIDSHTIV